MRVHRRTFLAAATGGGLAACAGPRGAAVTDPTTKDDLPTPALLLDLDLFEANLRAMAEHCRGARCGFRPHAKTHKCPEIARRQVASGALGVSVATVAEAEAVAAAGVRGILLTSPVLVRGKFARLVELAKAGAEVMLALGHPRQADLLAEAAGHARLRVDVLVDLDVGDRRTGTLPGEPALELARRIGGLKPLRLRGLQAYAGHASHVVGFEARRQRSRESLARAVETRELLSKAGFDAAILSGGSTGTYNIDSSIPGVTELQVGSYVFMDADYRRIGGRAGDVYEDFQPALSVLSTVVSATHADRVTLDAGVKALDTTVPFKPEAKGRHGLVYERGGDEFGYLVSTAGAKLPGLGERVEFIVPHCDPTANLYDRIHATRGEKVEDVWAIAARREASPLRRR